MFGVTPFFKRCVCACVPVTSLPPARQLFNSNRTAAWTVEAAQGGRLEAAIVATATTAAAEGEEEEVTGEEVEVEVAEEGA